MTEIGGVLDICAGGRPPCSDVAELLATKLGDVKVQMVELRSLRRELETLIARGQHLDPADCSKGDVCDILGTRSH